MRYRPLLAFIIFLTACGSSSSDGEDTGISLDVPEIHDSDTLDVAKDTDEKDSELSPVDDLTDVPPPTFMVASIRVTLDDKPLEKVLVLQAGKPENHDHTLSDGTIELLLDLTILGDISVAASHPDARIAGVLIFPEFPQDEYLIALTSFDKSDNEDFEFDPPGEPDNAPNTEYCGHCHLNILEDWFGSEHRKSASNTALQDLYAGAAATFDEEGLCVEKGGKWQLGLDPATGDPLWRCYLGSGVLSTLNPGCDSDGPCDGKGTAFGACADCHAPNINGKLGGRDLFDAKGDAFRWGVQCDACHRVESVDLDAEPGVAGRLKIVRPSEPSISATLGVYAPMVFGPSHDSLNVRMGSVQRDHYHQAELCAGCHEQEQAVLVPGESIDSERWPNGRLPIHSTFSEWKAGPMNPAAPCQSCHMPPDPSVSNSADQQTNPVADIGWVAGWLRPPGSINQHTWDGPRAVDSGMLESAAALFVTKSVANGLLEVEVKSKNVGPGHAIPTGEPMRSMVLTVEAHCGETPLKAVGGNVVPGFGGSLARQSSDGDWSQWPGASVGDVIAVVNLLEQWIDYTGFGPFGDGTFSSEQKGMRVEQFVGSATVLSTDGDAVTLDAVLPAGSLAYRLGQGARAGLPGFGFARVLVGKNGKEMVPHYKAVDVKSDNRLLPQQSFVSTHQFEAGCENPTVSATLFHRAYPFALARERGWPLKETLMTKVVK